MARPPIRSIRQTIAFSPLTLTLWVSDSIDPECWWPDEEILLPPPDTASGVMHMLVSNRSDLSDGVWEPCAITRPWTLIPRSDPTAVFVKYRDAAGNETDVASATIRMYLLYLPTSRQEAQRTTRWPMDVSDRDTGCACAVSVEAEVGRQVCYQLVRLMGKGVQ